MGSPDRSARIGIIISVAAVLVIGLASAGIFVLVRFGNDARPPGPLAVAAGNGANANLVTEPKFARRIFASAVLDLPPVPVQNDSPSLQLALVQGYANIQGGIIRTPATHFRLQSFVAYARPSERIQLEYLGMLSDRPHTVSFVAQGNDLAFAVDAKTVRHFNRPDYFQGAGPFLMLGTSVASAGDAASGTISGISVQGDNDPLIVDIKPACSVTTDGLEIHRLGTVWTFGGRNTPGGAPRFTNCSQLGRNR
jgi:hypothetical protein